ncbi:MAG: DUF3471 domain-containing protein [Proteobacteria bacterium]|nr:DUF3471 domain-containing protein [Pseudomonadota bacterium]
MTTSAAPAARGLPARPNLERLKNEAKQRLDALRATTPHAKLAAAQFQLARDYGFLSWRDLKAEVDRRSGVVRAGPDGVGDWIGLAGPRQRLALHIRRGADGMLSGTIDNVDYNLFDIPLDGLTVENGRLAYTLVSPEAESVYEARWDDECGVWSGEYLAHGLKFPLKFTPGAYPSAPALPGLDGFWDGALVAKGKTYRMTFKVRTGAHGTLCSLDSPDGAGTNLPVAEVLREGDKVSFVLRTIRIDGQLSADREAIEARYRTGETDLPLRLERRARGAPAPRPPLPPEVELSAEQLAAVAGTYRFRVGEPWTFTVENGRLMASVQGFSPMELIATSPTEFAWRTMSIKAEFELGPDGRAQRMGLLQPGRAPQTGERI